MATHGALSRHSLTVEIHITAKSDSAVAPALLQFDSLAMNANGPGSLR